MIVLQDTRNQPGKHKRLNEQLKLAGYRVERCKLFVGDYAFANDMRRCVDTKKDVLELIQDMHHDHERFKAECQRAQDAGIQLLILIEEQLPGGRLANWRSPRNSKGIPLTRTDPFVLRRALKTMSQRYGVVFRFCAKKDTGRILIDFLKGAENDGSIRPEEKV